jgi:hypothetical protein
MIDKEYYESTYFRSYTDLRKYANQNREYVAEIMMALHHPGGGVKGEFAVRWQMLGGKAVPQLQAYSDSWLVLHCMSDLIQVLAEHDDEDITPDELIQILESLDFINTDSYQGDYLPEERFQSYQIKRKRSKKLDQIL